jgi:hypothetical protein
LVPAAAVEFFSAAERVHLAKAGPQAERSALRGAAARAQAALTKSEAGLAKARAEANAARAQKRCGPVCRTKLAAEVSAQADGKPRGGSCSPPRARPRRTVLCRRRRGYSLRRLIWLPSWRSGRASQGTVQGRFASLFRSSVEWLRSASQSGQTPRREPRLCSGTQRTTTPTSFPSTQLVVLLLTRGR